MTDTTKMNETNVVGWFDIYVDDLKRAVAFYEAVLERKLESIGGSNG